MSTKMAAQSVREVRGLHTPPTLTVDTMAAVLVVMGYTQTQAQDWKHTRKVMVSPAFLQQILTFDPSTLTPDLAKLSREMLAHFSHEDAKNTSLSTHFFYKWVLDKTSGHCQQQ